MSTRPPLGPARRSGALWLFAALGVATLALLLHTWGGWLTDPSTTQPSPGSDHYPYLWALRGTEALTTVAGYQIPWSLMAMKGDSFPRLPSYLMPGEDCGQPGLPLCASQYLRELRDHPADLPTVR